MQSGERYGMPSADMQPFTTAALGTSGGVGGGARGLAHLFGHSQTATANSDMSGLHHTLREQQQSFQQLHSHRPTPLPHVDQHQYIPSHQLELNQHLKVRGNAPHLLNTHNFLHPAGVSSGHGGLHHQMTSFFSSSAMSGQQQQPPQDSHNFSIVPGRSSQDQFKLPNSNHLREDIADQSSPSQWRAEETSALIKICSDMDSPLWDEVSRKLQEMGHQRSPQKCKVKFESIQKSYKKGKAGEDDAEQRPEFSSEFTSEGGHAVHVHVEGDHAPNVVPISDNFDKDIDDEQDAEDHHLCLEEDSNMGKSKKRKMDSSWTLSKSFFEKLTREIMEKQEQMHRAFLDTIERKDKERALREDAYRRHEAARLDREQEIRAQQVSMAASRDAALIAFLEKVTGASLSKLTNLLVPPFSSNPNSASPHVAASLAAAALLPQQSSEHQLLHQQALQDAADMDNNSDLNTKRWPKVEVHALIRLRSGMEPRFREAGPKAHLWQEISTSMACLGFIRSPKRCKEKWENINKYFKKTKDSSKKRPENTKTCPYFHQLDTLYQRGILASSSSSGGNKLLGGKSDDLLDYNTHEDEAGVFNVHENANAGDRVEGNGSESMSDLAMKVQHGEHAPGRDTDMNTNQVHMLDASHGIFVSDLYHNSQNSNSGASMVALSKHSSTSASMVPISQHMDKFLHNHTHHEGLDMGANSKKSNMPVEMFVKDILNLQQQQHQKLIDEYDRMEQAHELRDLERQQIKAGVVATAANTHDNATLMALVHRLAGDSSDITMSAPSSME